jgi:hypothetical protein
MYCLLATIVYTDSMYQLSRKKAALVAAFLFSAPPQYFSPRAVIYPQMRQALYILVILLQGLHTRAQELNLGVHLNPTFTSPVLDGKSAPDKGIFLSRARPDVNVGININYKTGNLALETGLNLVGKQAVFKVGDISRLGFSNSSYGRVTMGTTSLEVPLLASYCFHHHDKKLVYDVYLVGGGSYEWISPGATSEGSGGVSGFGGGGEPTIQVKRIDATTLPSHRDEWANIVAGFKINTVLRVLGLIDYGITYHLPLKTYGTYDIHADVVDYASGTGVDKTYHGTYNPRMGYIDFKFCYYFLNFDRDFNKVHHRFPKDS